MTDDAFGLAASSCPSLHPSAPFNAFATARNSTRAAARRIRSDFEAPEAVAETVQDACLPPTGGHPPAMYPARALCTMSAQVDVVCEDAAVKCDQAERYT